MQTYVLLFSPAATDQSGRRPATFNVQAERIDGAVRQALAMETKLFGLTLRAV